MDEAELVRFRYAYDEDTGEWLWRNPPERAGRKKARPGDHAGTVDHRDDCLYLRLNEKLRRASQMAWLYVKGEWPPTQIQYVDPGLPLPQKDRFSNLMLSGKIRELTQASLKGTLDYDQDTGHFHWKVARKGIKRHEPAGTVKMVESGAAIGSKKRRGYRYIRVDGEQYMAQHLAWLYVTGEWPTNRLSFRNGDQLDCRFDNLIEGEFSHGTRRDAPLSFEEKKIRDKARYRKHDLKRTFGLSVDEYQAMHDAQGGLCAICRDPETKERNGRVKWLAVDHNHKAGEVRELLCQNCNHMIGHSRERIDILEAAISYLRRHAEKEEAA